MERERFGLRSVQGPRHPSGIGVPVYFDTDPGNREQGVHIFGNWAFDPSKWHSFFDDFDRYVAGDWTITNVGVTPTQTLADIDGGGLLITLTAGVADSSFLQKKGESFLFEAGKPLVLGARFKVSDAVQSVFVMGLQITDTTPLDVTDGVFFMKDDGDANIDFHVEKANVASSALVIGTVVTDTFVSVEFAYDGRSAVHYGVNGLPKGSLPVTNLPATELTVSFGIQNGEAVAKTETVDYVFCAKYRG